MQRWYRLAVVVSGQVGVEEDKSQVDPADMTRGQAATGVAREVSSMTNARNRLGDRSIVDRGTGSNRERTVTVRNTERT